MKLFVVAVCLIVAVAAAPSSPETAARRALPALQHEEIHDEFGQYALRYVTAEGTVVSERGRLVPNPDGTGHVLVTEGETSYIGDDGRTYVTKYSAGFDGVKVEGNHLPVAPEPLPVK
ncbi:flexible cuticle protein 12-like [Pectinophora gossypiella]|uniref:flexible cuticle protein 12-like n=1 Tax=Pectinophora gossypiella TaxID=13191 RepID=UPI00214ED029|nr:flexible cuticle protein 12-like [Pectinophora gossypiella]